MNLATAIVVARANSQRLPNKALLPFAGTTLIGHKVSTLLRCKLVGRVVVGSDSQAILDEAARHGATTVRRDDYHCDESRCSANEMIRDMVEDSYDLVVATLSRVQQAQLGWSRLARGNGRNGDQP